MTTADVQERPSGTLRIRLACATEEEFLEKHAAVIATRGLFVPMPRRPAPGTCCRLELSFLASGVQVLGEACVARHARFGDRLGVLIRFTRLDPESLQFPLLPQGSRSEPWVEEPTRALDPPSSEVPWKDDSTRVHGYSQSELAAAGDPDSWGGGLRPFDRIRNYQLLSRVGTGGMAEVFLSRCELGNGAEKLVALKMVLPEFGPGSPFATLFLNEARVSASLQHPNLVQVFDTGEAAGRGYLAMEYVHGRSLSAVLRKLRALGAPPPLGLAVAVGIGLCQALDYLHTKRGLDGRFLNLVHRDLSPGNILISETGELKLVDFGVAAATLELTTEDLVVGKRAYMAPEQAQGDAPSPSWDLFSLGVILHELLTLEQLNDGDTPFENFEPVRRVRDQLPPSSSNPQVPAALDRVVMWLTDPDPSRRAQIASSVRTALEAVRHQVPPCDLRSLMNALHGAELREERIGVERMVAIAHQRGGAPRASASEGPFRHLSLVRRRVQTAPAWRRLTRQRQALQWAFGALLAHLLFFGPLFYLHHQQQTKIDHWLTELDRRMQHSQLTGSGGDTALGALGELRRLAPKDARVQQRRRQLGDLFLALARAAEARGDLGEAAAHYQAALETDPAQVGVRERLQGIDDAVRQHVTPEIPAR